MQILTVVIAGVLTYFLFTKPSNRISNLIKIYSAFTYLWISGVYFVLFGFIRSGGGGDKIFGAMLFGFAAILLMWDIVAKKIEFKPPDKKWQRNLTILIVSCALLYPLIGFAFGHHYPRVVSFGVIPCPTVAFTLALLCGSIPSIDVKLYILLLVWAIAGSIGGILIFGAYEDLMLLGTGVYSLAMLAKNWKNVNRVNCG